MRVAEAYDVLSSPACTTKITSASGQARGTGMPLHPGRPVSVPGAVPHPGRPGADDHPRAPRGRCRWPAHRPGPVRPRSLTRPAGQPDLIPDTTAAPVSQAVWDPCQATLDEPPRFGRHLIKAGEPWTTRYSSSAVVPLPYGPSPVPAKARTAPKLSANRVNVALRLGRRTGRSHLRQLRRSGQAACGRCSAGWDVGVVAGVDAGVLAGLGRMGARGRGTRARDRFACGRALGTMMRSTRRTRSGKADGEGRSR